MNKGNKTAILLFSRTAEEEAAVKVFDPRLGKRGNGAIARRLIRHTSATARKSRLPIIHCSTELQSGANFGKRLANAMAAVFAVGYENVIAIGNDCPSLTAEQLRHSARQLESGCDLVLGPAADGGVYLIGMRKSAFCFQQFAHLPWQSANLIEGWAAYAEGAQQGIAWLTLARDIDQAADFLAALKALTPHHRLAQQLYSILNGQQSSVSQIVFPHLCAPVISSFSHRGPPLH